mgnify:CR=1 FL=1
MLRKKKKAMQNAHHSKLIKRDDGSILIINYDEFNHLISQDSYNHEELLDLAEGSSWTSSSLEGEDEESIESSKFNFSERISSIKVPRTKQEISFENLIDHLN